VRFLILGPLEVRAGERVVSVPGRKERAILGLLVVEAGTVVSSDRMVFELWGDAPPTTADRTLRSHVSKLRRALGGDDSPILTQRPGYVLATDRADIDAALFESLADKAAGLPDARDMGNLAREALSLWRGEALADLIGFRFAETEARRLEERRLGTVELRLEADLRVGLHEQVIPELRTLVAEHPYRERFWGKLMLALYRSGRAGEALEVFNQAGVALGESLGIGPSVDLRSLERSIVLEDEALDVSRGVPPHNLPAPTSTFIGRERDIEGLAEVLGRSRLVTMTGAGGSGKSRLALEAATRLLPGFGDGVWRVELAAVRDRHGVPAAVSSAMGDPASHAFDPTAALVDYLRGRRALLILDNCEHLLEACADLASTVTSRCPDIVVLATSREPLRVPGETVWLVPPLRLPDLTQEHQEQEGAEAFRLFVDRASGAAPGFSVTDENRRQITALCIALAGLPLAIELAAVRSAAFSPEQLLSRLAEGLDVLGGGSRTALEHHRTMRAALDWSYRLLDDNEARLFTQLAAFRGGWTLSDLGPVVSATSDDRLADRLASLVDRSLVEVIDSDERRYRLLEPVREFARRLLHASHYFAQVGDRHAAHYLSLARQADEELRGPDQVQWLRRMEAEHGNVRKALRWSLGSDRVDLALQLVAATAWFWFMAGHWRESWSWLQEALTAAGTAYPADRAAAVYRAGGLQVIRNNSGLVMPLIEETLDVCRRIGDREGEAWCLHLIGHSRGFDADPEALAPLQESRAIFDDLNRPWEVAWSDRYIGDALLDHKQAEEAVNLQLTSISAFRELGDQWSTAYGMHNAANLLLQLPEYGPSAARPYYERCLRLAEEIGDPVWTAHGVLGLGLCDRMAGVGDPEPMFTEAQDRLRLIGDDNCLCTAVGYLGELRHERGDDPGAATALADALRIGSRIGKTAALAINLDRLGRVAQRRGEARDAQRLVGAVEAALVGDHVRLPPHYLSTHQSLVKSLALEPATDEDLEAVVVYALELAERIAADR